jgi:protein-tyrosine phosphatase
VLKRILRPLVPKRLLQERDIFVRLGPEAGRIYLRLRLLDAVGVRHFTKRRVPQGARSFVFVCFGNIMRSPGAERMLKRAVAELGQEGITVTSAGMHTLQGREADPRAQVAAREVGLPLDRHRSQVFTAETAAQADVIFAMDFQNAAQLLAQFPEGREKIFMLSAYAEEGQRYREIADPYFGDQDEARRCFAVLQTCVTNLVKSLWPVASEAAGQQAGGVR